MGVLVREGVGPMTSVCCYCTQEFDPRDLRGYGPGGALTCYPCAMSTPERQATAEAAFRALAEAAAAMSPDGIVTITDTGLQPGVLGDLR